MLRSLWRAFRLFLKTFSVLLITIAVVPAAMGATALGIVLFTPVPVKVPEPKQLPSIQASHVYDQFGTEITVFKQFDSNIPVGKSDIPLVLKRAVISVEDRNFYAHGGIDIRGSFRALVRDIEAKEAAQGGSTITQQYVKNVYANNDAVAKAEAAGKLPDGGVPDTAPSPAAEKAGIDRLFAQKRNLGQKLREAIIANRLDRTTSKEDILFGYLTNIYLGNGAYGVGAASKTYFRKSVKELTLSEAATLAGIIPAPSEYEPRHNTYRAEVKRGIVLKAMRVEGYITEAEYRTALAQVLWVESQGAPPAGQPVTLVYEPEQVVSKYPYFVDYVRRYLLAKYGEAAVYGGGLQVQTTIDPKIQADAERTLAEALKGTRPPLEMALVAVEPLTGYVKAIVGGRDFKADNVNLALGHCPTSDEFTKWIKDSAPKLPPPCQQQNDIDGGGTGRSPGSSIKPIVLAAAYSQGYPPSAVISGARYKPKCASKPIGNYEGAAYGAVSLKTATIKSVNTTYARLGYEYVGIENVARMAQRLGITSAWYDPRRHCASYSLGGIDVSPLEMASAYSVFAGRGLRAATTPVVRVLDAQGRVLEDNTGNRTRRAIAQNVADNVTAALVGAVEDGTGTKAQLKDRPAAGKTGTSQGWGNAWFVGYTPTLSTSVWIGYKDRPRPLYGIRGVSRVTGGSIPAQTWQRFMTRAMDGVPVTAFNQPAPIRRVAKVDPKILKQRQARRGIDAGSKRKRSGIGTQTFVQTLAGPSVDAPPQTLPPSLFPLSPATTSPPQPAAPTPAAAPSPTAQPIPAVVPTTEPATTLPPAPDGVVVIPTVPEPDPPPQGGVGLGSPTVSTVAP